MHHFNHKVQLLLAFLISTLTIVAQDTLDLNKERNSDKKIRIKKLGLYDGEYEEEYNIRGFTKLDIFDGSLTDFWSTESVSCISGKLLEDDVQNILNVKWNSDQNGCDWVGMGFGWDGWKGKDLNYVIDTLAIELIVRSKGENFTNIPWAFCLEDYSGTQAWLGYNIAFLQEESISAEWTKVQIPLSKFPIKAYKLDASNIKQLLIQVFAEGEIQIKSIKLIPFSGGDRKEVSAEVQNIKVDGDISEWKGDFQMLKDQEFSIAYNEENLYIAFKTKDETPRQNDQKGSNLWNGDAVEIAFSTNPSVDPTRPYLLLSDQHVGVNCGANPYMWNWKTDSKIENAQIAFKAIDSGYIVEIAIPFNAFRNFSPASGSIIDMEIAIDLGTNNGRQTQLRWNSGDQDGFHLSPSLWGALKLK